MTPWSQVVAVWCVVVLAGTTSAQSPAGWERYLERPHGPYRGQVIDAETRAPLVGAVVVAHWARDRIYPFHSVMKHYAVREVVTGADGAFLIDARDIEERAPSRTLYPRFLIFTPGYGFFPLRQKKPTGFIGGIFEGTGTVVELMRQEDSETRRNSLLRILPNSFTDQPFKDLPALMDRINEERTSIGLAPIVPARER